MAHASWNGAQATSVGFRSYPQELAAAETSVPRSFLVHAHGSPTFSSTVLTAVHPRQYPGHCPGGNVVSDACHRRILLPPRDAWTTGESDTPVLTESPSNGPIEGAGAAAPPTGRKRRLDVAAALDAPPSASGPGGFCGAERDTRRESIPANRMAVERAPCSFVLQSAIVRSRAPPASPLQRSRCPAPSAGCATPATTDAAAEACRTLLALSSGAGRGPAANPPLDESAKHRQQRQFRNNFAAPVTAGTNPAESLLYVGVTIERPPHMPPWGLNVALFEGAYLVLGRVDDSVARAITTWGRVAVRPPSPALLRGCAQLRDLEWFRRTFAALPSLNDAPSNYDGGGGVVRPGLRRLQSGDAIFSLDGRPVSSFPDLDAMTAYLRRAQTLAVAALRHTDALRSSADALATGWGPRGAAADAIGLSADRSFRALRRALAERDAAAEVGAPRGAGRAVGGGGGGVAARRSLLPSLEKTVAMPAPAPRTGREPGRVVAPSSVALSNDAGISPPETRACAGTDSPRKERRDGPWARPHQPCAAPERDSTNRPLLNGAHSAAGHSVGSAWPHHVMPDVDDDYDPDKYPWLWLPRVPLDTLIETDFPRWLKTRRAEWRKRWNVARASSAAAAAAAAAARASFSSDAFSDDDESEERVPVEFWRARGFPTLQHWLAASKAEWRKSYSWNRTKRRRLERECEEEVHFPWSASSHGGGHGDDGGDPAELDEQLREWLRVRKNQWRILRRKRQRQLSDEAAAAAEAKGCQASEAAPPTCCDASEASSNGCAAEIAAGGGTSPEAIASAAKTSLPKPRSALSDDVLIDAILEDRERQEKELEDRPPFDIAFLFDAALGAPDDVIAHCMDFLHRSEHGKMLCVSWGTSYSMKQRDGVWRALCPKHWVLPRRPRKPWHALYVTKIREEEEQVRKQSDEVLLKASPIIAKADSLHKIERLVCAARRKFGFSVDYVSGIVLERNSLLNLAVIERRHKIAKWLIERAGADVETFDRGQFTPLLNAAWEGDKYMVRYLLGRGADRAKVGTGHSSQALAHPDFKGLTAEGWARKRGHEEVAELIRLGLA